MRGEGAPSDNRPEGDESSESLRSPAYGGGSGGSGGTVGIAGGESAAAGVGAESGGRGSTAAAGCDGRVRARRARSSAFVRGGKAPGVPTTGSPFDFLSASGEPGRAMEPRFTKVVCTVVPVGRGDRRLWTGSCHWTVSSAASEAAGYRLMSAARLCFARARTHACTSKASARIRSAAAPSTMAICIIGAPSSDSPPLVRACSIVPSSGSAGDGAAIDSGGGDGDRASAVGKEVGEDGAPGGGSDGGAATTETAVIGTPR